MHPRLQLLLGIFPKLLGKLLLLGNRTILRGKEADRLIKPALLDRVPRSTDGPQVVKGALLNRNHLAHHRDADEEPVGEFEIVDQTGLDGARVDAEGEQLGMAAGQLARVEHVGELAVAVANPAAQDGGFLRGFETRKFERPVAPAQARV